MAMTSSKDELMALAARRFEVVGNGDIEATMSLFVDEPVFELYPVGLQLCGQTNVRRYYENFFRSGDGAMEAENLLTLFSDDAIAFDLKLTKRSSSGNSEVFRLMSIMQVVDGRFTGERLYGDERLFRIIFGEPIWPLMTPIEN